MRMGPREVSFFDSSLCEESTLSVATFNVAKSKGACNLSFLVQHFLMLIEEREVFVFPYTPTPKFRCGGKGGAMAKIHRAFGGSGPHDQTQTWSL